MNPLIPNSEPFFFQGRGANSQTGCLLLHGFTGTPYEMRGLGQHIAAEGYTVLGPRLAHHGTRPDDMNRSRWWDWYYSALDGWHLLNQMCDRVIVIGHSMGGVTALLLAANNPVAGVIAMSTPAVFMDRDNMVRLSPYLWRLRPLLNKPNVDESWPSYNHVPVRAAGELLHYRRAMVAALSNITAPALLLHATHDPTVPFKNMDYLYQHLKSAVKQQITIEQGGHTITEDVDKEKVYQKVIAFLAQIGA